MSDRNEGRTAHRTLDGQPLDYGVGMMHSAALEVWRDSDRYGEKPRAVAAYVMSLAAEVQSLRGRVAELEGALVEADNAH